MRHQTREFVELFFKDHTGFRTVLEVGSGDVNGNIRDLFKDMEYVGIDMRPGPNVDIVLNAHDLRNKYKEGDFDLVVCFDTLEHDDKFWLTVDTMREVLKPGGWMLLGVPGRNCEQHLYPSDYWRFMGSSVIEIFFKNYEEVYTEIQLDDPAHE